MAKKCTVEDWEKLMKKAKSLDVLKFCHNGVAVLTMPENGEKAAKPEQSETGDTSGNIRLDG